MHINIYFFLVKYFLIFSIQYDFAKAFVGHNVREANAGEFNFIVSFKIRDNRNPTPEVDHLCTGAMISVKDVITTSHGFDAVRLQSFEILVGSIDLRSNTKRYPAWWISYIEWARFNNIHFIIDEHDIAIIRISEEIPNTITPVIILPLPCGALFGQNVTVAGWGKLITGDIHRYLRVADLTILTKYACENTINMIFKLIQPYSLPNNVFCSSASPSIHGTSGDSGAPVLYMGLLVAIHTGVLPSTLPNLHTRKVNLHVSIADFTTFFEHIFNIR